MVSNTVENLASRNSETKCHLKRKLCTDDSNWGYRENFLRTKTQMKPKPNNKNTTKWTKNNKDNNFLRIKISNREEISYFLLWCSLYAQNFFVKKIVLITWFTIFRTCTPINPPIEDLFARTYFYLWSSVRISYFYENLIYLWESLLILRIF